MMVAIIQARMGSSRLPGKVLAELAGKPMLLHVAERVGRSRAIDRLLVATSDQPGDDPLAGLCAAHGIDCFRGSEHDVLDRFYQAARSAGASQVVRITADCPLIEPRVIDRVVRAFQQTAGCVYASNTLLSTYPDGLDVEVFSFAALEEAWQQAVSPLEREHVTPYIRRAMNGSDQRLLPVRHHGPPFPSHWRWTVDEAPDLELVRTVYARLYPENPAFGMEEVAALLRREPELAAINRQLPRNEGLYASLLDEAAQPARRLNLARSQTLARRATRRIPAGTQTLSKGRSQFVQGVAPIFLERGDKARVWDVDGNEFVDCILALGPVILGYNHPAVNQAVSDQLGRGASLSLPHRLEVEVAEQLAAVIPCAEMVRFGKNGSDVTAGAVRAARAYTGRELVACCGYHGWQDWYIGTTSRHQGVPESVRGLTKPFVYNDLDSLAAIFAEHPGQVAAVIMEPVSVEEPGPGFLEQVRELAHANGALLIFDEVITGFRLASGGAQQYYGVVPDLACFGKAMANGLPLAAVVGRQEVMEVFERIFFSFTFGGETLSLAAARATIETFCREPVVETLWQRGGELREGVNVLARRLGLEEVVRCEGLAPRTVVRFRHPDCEPLLLKSLVQQELIERGVLWAGYHNLCYATGEAEVMAVLRGWRAALEVLVEALASGQPERFLRGRPMAEVFRKL